MLRIKIKPKRTPVEYLIMLICIALLTCIVLLTHGCAVSESTESLEMPYVLEDGTKTTVEWKSKVSQSLFLYWTNAKKIDKRTPFTSTEVGEFKAKPDPESIDAVTEALKNPIIELLRGVR